MIAPVAFVGALALTIAACAVLSRLVDRVVPWLDRIAGGRG